VTLAGVAEMTPAWCWTRIVDGAFDSGHLASGLGDLDAVAGEDGPAFTRRMAGWARKTRRTRRG